MKKNRVVARATPRFGRRLRRRAAPAPRRAAWQGLGDVISTDLEAMGSPVRRRPARAFVARLCSVAGASAVLWAASRAVAQPPAPEPSAEASKGDEPARLPEVIVTAPS